MEQKSTTEAIPLPGREELATLKDFSGLKAGFGNLPVEPLAGREFGLFGWLFYF